MNNTNTVNNDNNNNNKNSTLIDKDNIDIKYEY